MMSLNVTIQRCSACSNLIDDRRISAGGVIFPKWTDGKTNNSAVNVSNHSTCFLVKCPYCLKNIWFNALEIYSSESLLLGKPDGYDKSKPFSKPKFQDYVEELNAGRVAVDKEEDFRHVMWWVGNDRRRDIRKKKPMLDAEVDNLHILANMIDGSSDYKLFNVAEIKRELGLFNEASSLLKQSFKDPRMETERVFLQRLVNNKDYTVRAYTHK